MKDILEFINEAKEFNPENIVNAYDDNSKFLDYVAAQTQLDRKDFQISLDGIKYKRILIPGTKLSQRLTGEELLNLVFEYLVKKNEIDQRLANLPKEKRKVKHLRKDKEVSWLRGTKGGALSAEKMSARRNAENNRIIRGLPDDEEIYRG